MVGEIDNGTQEARSAGGTMRSRDKATSKESRSNGSSSFLVRLWREPQSNGDGPVRVYVRNLRTGEEMYLGNPSRFGEVLDLELECREAEKESHQQDSQANDLTA